MLLETALLKFLSQSVAVGALVGSGPDARIYPVVLPQTPTLPTLTYQRVGSVRDRAMRGPTGTSFARVQFDAWAPATDAGGGYAAAKGLADAVRRAVDGYAGAMGDATVGTLFVQLVEVENDRDGYEPAVKLFRAGFDMAVWWTEGTA